MSVLLLLGVLLGGWLSVSMIIQADGDLLWIIAGGIALICVVLCTWGLWRLRRWALRLSWLLALAALGLGGFSAWFAWGFWLFEEPTLGDRIKALLNPPVSLLVVCPILWLTYFTRTKIRAQFQRDR